ncbi:MAG: type II toxin-antitoxin system Phd/YefM family antitoxin [Candidatus Sumerlaeota bacterium]|nr:type II toxin-antitoxin system Phd/YefM family antitoxin [Candidatus Sumerlaeota bacterium]
MSHQWQLQEAKNRFSEVVNRAQTEGPQTITRRGKETAVILSMEDYQAMTKPRESLVEFMRKSPWRGVDLNISRSKEPSREIDL